MVMVKDFQGLKKQSAALGVCVSLSVCALTLSACQTLPTSPNTGAAIPQSTQSSRSNTNTPTTYNADGYPTQPAQSGQTDAPNYPAAPQSLPSHERNPLTQPVPAQPLPTIPSRSEPILTPPDTQIYTPAPTREDYMINEPVLPSHSDLLERARKNSKQQNRKSASNQSDLPAYQNLMQTGTRQLKSGDINGAESSFTRAQRLAPKSGAVYYYLSQVALKKNQPRKAEAMARRGLSVSNDTNRRRALWQLILKSGQAQNNARVIREAQQALR